MKRQTTPTAFTVLIWAIALGFHGLVIMLPISQSPEKKAEETQPGNVRVVQLAKREGTKTPKDEAPKLAVKPTMRSLVVPEPKKPVAPKPAPTPKPVAAKPSPKPQQTVSRSNKASETQTPAKPNQEGKTEGKPPTKPDPPINPGDLVVDLGQMPGAVPCEDANSCWRSEDSQWRSVYANVKDQLTDQGYRVMELDLDDDTGFRVSQISRNGKTQYYLHLLSTLRGTVYVLNPTQLSKDEVEQKIT